MLLETALIYKKEPTFPNVGFFSCSQRPGYNLGQYKMEQFIIPHPSQRNDEGAKEQKTCHFGIIEMGGGVAQMFHLFCPRLYAGFQRDKTKGASN